jgi:hypothetical protein
MIPLSAKFAEIIITERNQMKKEANRLEEKFMSLSPEMEFTLELTFSVPPGQDRPEPT